MAEPPPLAWLWLADGPAAAGGPFVAQPAARATTVTVSTARPAGPRNLPVARPDGPRERIRRLLSAPLIMPSVPPWAQPDCPIRYLPLLLRVRLHTQSFNCIIIHAQDLLRSTGPAENRSERRAAGPGGSAMGARVAVAGASGYAGGELLRLIAGHPGLELGAVTADSNAGRLVGEIHPNLAGLPSLAGRKFEATGAGGALDSDLVFLALPAGLLLRLPALSSGVWDSERPLRYAANFHWGSHHARAEQPPL